MKVGEICLDHSGLGRALENFQPQKCVEEAQGIQLEWCIQEVIHILVFVFIPRRKEDLF